MQDVISGLLSVVESTFVVLLLKAQDVDDVTKPPIHMTSERLCTEPSCCQEIVQYLTSLKTTF